MTSKEIDERIARHLTEAVAIGGVFHPNGTKAEDIKQLIRDCIEGVTPERPDHEKWGSDSHAEFRRIGFNGAISGIQANTKELLG